MPQAGDLIYRRDDALGDGVDDRDDVEGVDVLEELGRGGEDVGQLALGDDGRGLDFERIRERAAGIGPGRSGNGQPE